MRLPLISLTLSILALPATLWPQPWALTRAGVADGAFWQLWTGQLSHFGAAHLAADLAATLLAGGILEQFWPRRQVAGLVLLALPLLACSMLWLAPAISEFRGLSGLATLLTFAVLATLWQNGRVARLGLLLIGSALVLRLLADATGMGALPGVLPAGIVTVWQAHAAGMLLGLLAAGLQRRMTRRPYNRPTASPPRA